VRRLGLILVILLTLTVVALGIRQRLLVRRERVIERLLEKPIGGEPAPTFDPDMVAELPAPARRYLRHTIAEGTPLARSVRLTMQGRMRPSSDASPMALTIEQLLVPWHGFLWWAQVDSGPLMIRVTDHYAEEDGAVRVAALGGLVPMGTESGSDVTRSSRHRLAAESVWLPAAFLPAAGARWTAVDDQRARVTLTIDGEAIPLTLRVDEVGRLRELTMERHGNEGRTDWGPTPYGFAVEAESTFEGYTIPSQLRGGWWYGSEHYDEAGASEFTLTDATYR
jgi:hypothetical protein